MKTTLTIAALGFLLATQTACTLSTSTVETSTAYNEANSAKLDSILAAQPADVQARFIYRHPKETLQFFGIEPGMTVVEALPGGGWYSSIIGAYLGEKGHLIGANYPDTLWPNFTWASESFISSRIQSTKEFATKVKEWVPNNTPNASGYTLDGMPDELSGQVDAVLYIRALHNLARFNKEHQYLDNALRETHRILKLDGVVGIVQHSAPDKNLDGSRGYLNKDELIATMAKAGFSLVAESDINANQNDIPAADEIVWRLPPNYSTSGDDAVKKAEFAAIGESNRMTLLFKKTQ